MPISNEFLDPRIKLRHLRCFLEVARLNSVVQAARRLGLSQPAASKTIQELEKLLGAQLFDRSHRNLTLTSEGEVYFRYASAGVTALRQGMQSITSDALGALSFTIGALPTVSARVLPAVVSHFSTQRSNLRPRIVTGPNDFLIAQLRLGAVDIVLGRMAEPEDMRGFSFEHLYSEQVVFIVRPGHPLLSSSRFDPSVIGRYQVLMPPPDAIIRPTVERFLMANGVTAFTDQIETVSDAFARTYVRTTDAVWIISEGVTVEDVALGLLVPLPVNTLETLGPVGLTTRIDLAPSLGIDIFVNSVRHVVRKLTA